MKIQNPGQHGWTDWTDSLEKEAKQKVCSVWNPKTGRTSPGDGNQDGKLSWVGWWPGGVKSFQGSKMQLFILSGGYTDIYPGEKIHQDMLFRCIHITVCVLCLEKKIVYVVTRFSACSGSFWSFQRCFLHNEESIQMSLSLLDFKSLFMKKSSRGVNSNSRTLSLWGDEPCPLLLCQDLCSK